MINGAASNVLNSNFVDRFNFYGCKGPVAVGGNFVAGPVGRIPAPYTGTSGFSTIASTSNGNVTQQDFQWTWSVETHVEGGTIEFQTWGASFRWAFVLVDDRYVGDFTTGFAPASGSNQAVYLKVTGIPDGARVRLVLSGESAAANMAYLLSARVAPLGSFWKPAPGALKMAVQGDSFSIGFGPQSASITQNVSARAVAPFPIVMADYLGIKDVRQMGLGSTGLVANANGAAGNARELIAMWKDQAPFDLIVDTHGFNDRNEPATNGDVAYQDVVLDNLAKLRAFHAGPIVVLGSQIGARGATDANTLRVEEAKRVAVQRAADKLIAFAPVAKAVPPYTDGSGREGATTGAGNSDVAIGTDGTHPNLRGARLLGMRAAKSVRDAVNAMLAA
ncbi:lysophospholipase L1-like esterase [Sphingomonas sp. BK069]|nr:lysophospholipase L1-like esterase [Sphingomonas sp. BK069]